MAQGNDTSWNTNVNIPFFLFSHFAIRFSKEQRRYKMQANEKILIHLGTKRILMLLFYIPHLVTYTESMLKFASEWE